MAQSEELSLFEIETGLHDQIYERQMAMEQLADLTEGRVPGTKEELDVYYGTLLQDIALLEEGIREYAKAEITKVDNIARLWRYYEFCTEAAKKEATRLAKRAKAWENRLEYLKTIIRYALGVVGKKKVETPTHWLKIQKNSSQAVQIEPGREKDVPDRFIRVTATLPLDIWKDLLGTLTPQERSLVKFDGEFNLSLMAGELKKGAEIPGAMLVTGDHVRCS